MTHNIKWLVYLAVPVVPLIIWLNKQPLTRAAIVANERGRWG